MWSGSIKKVPCINPPPPKYLVKGQRRVAVGKRSKDRKSDENGETEQSYSSVPYRKQELWPDPYHERRCVHGGVEKGPGRVKVNKKKLRGISLSYNNTIKEREKSK